MNMIMMPMHISHTKEVPTCMVGEKTELERVKVDKYTDRVKYRQYNSCADKYVEFWEEEMSDYSAAIGCAVFIAIVLGIIGLTIWSIQ